MTITESRIHSLAASAFRNKTQLLSRIGRTAEAKEVINAGISVLEDSRNKALKLSLLLVLAEVHSSCGEWEEFLSISEKTLKNYTALKDAEGMGASLNALGRYYYYKARTEEALKYLLKAYDIFKSRRKYAAKTAGILKNIGNIYFVRGELNKALEYFGRSLVKSRMLGDAYQEGVTLFAIGYVRFQMNERQDALEHYKKALLIQERIQDALGRANSLSGIGGVHFAKGEYGPALKYYLQSLKIMRIIGDRQGIAHMLNNLGGTYFYLGRSEKTVECYEESVRIKEAMGDRFGVMITSGNIALILSEKKDFKNARLHCTKAIGLAESIGSKEYLLKGYLTAAEIEIETYCGLKVPDPAYLAAASAFLEKCSPLEVSFAQGEQIGLAEAFRGRILSKKGDMEKAALHFRKACDTLEKVNAPQELARCYYYFAEELKRSGKTDEMIEFKKKAIELFNRLGNMRWRKQAQSL